MNAKKILNLYEADRLTSEEIFSLINNYFKKKLVLLDAQFFSGYGAVVTISRDKSYSQEQLNRFSQVYFSSLLDELGFLYAKADWTTEIKVKLPKPKSVEWERSSIFKLFLEQPSGEVVTLHIMYSAKFDDCRLYKKLNEYEEFASESGLREVYKLIDVVIRAVRLVSFGEDNESYGYKDFM